MEEKKTKKMTKAEAFEWLKNKKVYVDGNSAVIQAKLFEVGFEWPENKRHISNLEQPFLILSEDGGIYYSNNMCHYLERSHEEISADDILSIEIVEDKNNEFVDCSEPCPEIKAVQELLRNSKHLKDKIIVITKDNAAVL